MEVGFIAATITGILVELFKGMLSETAKSAGKELFETIKSKFSKNPSSEKALKELANSPENKSAKLRAEASLIDVMESDKEFTVKLLALIEKIQENSGQANLTINGNVEGNVFSIGRIDGDVNLHGDLLLSYKDNLYRALGYAERPDYSMTDYIIELMSVHGKGELMSFDTAMKILLVLFNHPKPELAVSIISANRPREDILTLIVLTPVAHNVIDDSYKKMKRENYGVEHLQKIIEVLRSTEAMKTYIDETKTMPQESMKKLMAGHFESTRNGVDEWIYFRTHPEMLLMSVDMEFAQMGLFAFLDSNAKALESFMSKRQELANYRSAVHNQ